MMRALETTTCILLFACLTVAQQAPASQSASQANSSSAAASQFDPLLQRYKAAYEHQNMDDLLGIWPSLKDDKKTMHKIKEQFDRADISAMKMTVPAR